MDTRAVQPSRSLPPRPWVAALAALVLGGQPGCTREFFRDWANQDTSEAVFEKSRDPRWRLDLFSPEPPAMSRFGNPYDPDFPPAPPDDYAAQALSPWPQNPDNRLLIPAEGTPYLDMMESWRRAPAGPAAAPAAAAPAPAVVPGAEAPPPGVGAPPLPPPMAPPPTTPPPFAPPPNSGPAVGPTSPTSVPGSPPAVPPANPPGPGPRGPQAANGTRDSGVRRTAFQETQPPVPASPPTLQPLEPRVPTTPAPGTPPAATGPAPLEPSVRDLTQPVNPRPDLSPERYRASEEMGAAEMSALLNFGKIDFDIVTEAGFQKGDNPYVLTIDQAFRLALLNARVYQFNLEQIYIAALDVTLNRFTFMPQFFAGLSPTTAPIGAGFPGGLNPGNRFFYSTRETGVPASTLNIGTVAGVGKAFSAGGKLLMGFANQVVFNFFGKNSSQPAVQSFLPLSFVQPFLKGGGRAVTLEPLTQSERNLLYQVRAFALFRQQFTVALLVGGSIQNFGSAVPSLAFTGGGNADPTIGFVNVVEDIQLVENQRRNVAVFAQLVKVFDELKNGESSGLTQLQVDQLRQQLANARGNYFQARLTFRGDLDGFRQQMGLPPDTPIIPDRSLTQSFNDAFFAVDRWGLDKNRKLEDLPKFVLMLPVLQDVVLDGRSLLDVVRDESNSLDGSNNYESGLNEVYLAAERLALEHRVDLMNTRAQLYDAWRQVRVTANALKGVLNITITNQFLTPPTTTNPFGFLDQAKQFSLVLNAELPLIRMAERNAFRNALINYERQRRALMNAEDSLKQLVRGDIRSTLLAYLNYEIAKRNFVLFARQKDQAFEQIIAPPAAGAGGNVANAAIQTQNLVSAQSGLIGTENALVSTWYQYQQARLALYRDLGILPFDEWEAYDVLFPSESSGGGYGAASRDAGPARAAAAEPTQDVRRR
jgi:hypothetical protein